MDFVSISIDPEFDTPRVLKNSWRFDIGQGRDAPHRQGRGGGGGAGSWTRAKDNHKPLTFLRPAGSDEWVRLDGFPSTSELITNLRLKSTRASR